ncbi:alpha/beta fold hydrolase [Rhodococcus jostii]|uniref:Pimeloyl-ACP methyl ester carboxylesterase n=1 Tax=Rhodococcus jostii TaxID=132919 RepID=A0A1H5BPQ2_RHOJO|nr:alpha/beta hydrolase [Rhodococcus jostii]SED56258.1 Pimeloyl-ACP methyl ester carboxylesterase [Rhodococcus jostii]
MTVVAHSYDLDAAPDWFTRATAVEPELGTVDVDGARISYRVWGQPGGNPVILIHGGAANARWWDHVAPLLSDGRRVAALDLSGHGHSDHRSSYRRSRWADEVMAVAGIVGPRPVVVGHSLGGFVALETAGHYGSELAGTVVVDSPARTVRPVFDAERERRMRRKLRVYESEGAIVARFRPDPEDTPLPRYLRNYLGSRSIRETSGGFTWQFDPAISMAGGMIVDEVVPPSCPLALIRGERGMLSREMSRALADEIGPDTIELEIPDSGHHIMLEQPQALAAVLETLSRNWSICRPTNTAE